MSDTRIKALKSFSDGTISLWVGQIANVESSKASAFISGGLAEAYTDPINPSGSLSIDANGTYDVTDKASAVVNVSVCTVTYNVNGGEGTLDNVTAIKGNTIDLNDGTGVTAPEGKTFSGWGTSASATETVATPYQVTDNVTLYAVYVDTPVE